MFAVSARAGRERTQLDKTAMTELQPELSVLTRLELYFAIRQHTRIARRFADIFGNDYEMVIIFFVVAESCFQAILHLGGAAADREAIEQIYMDSVAGLSLFSIADASGVPRETVRRKIKILSEWGYLATFEKTKNIYVPVSALLDPKINEAFKRYVADLDHLVRMVQFYERRPVSPGGAPE